MNLPAGSYGTISSRGFSLVELMIALVLGLVVVGSVTGLFLSNKQSYRTNQALGQVQENARVAFELLARDIRQAGLTGCGNTTRVANVLNNQSTAWYANFANAVRGYDGDQADPAVSFGSTAALRVSGTDSIQVLGVGNSGLSVADHNATAANFKLNDTSSDLQEGDIILVCDPDHATITQITNYNDSNVTLVHNTGTTLPGNCSKGLGYPSDCSSTNGNPYEFGTNSQVAKLAASDWYIGINGQGGRSLYRRTLVNNAGTPTPTAQEMVRNVVNMQIVYLRGGNISYQTATAVGSDWASVEALQVSLSFESADRFAATGAAPVAREMKATITLRNRVS